MALRYLTDASTIRSYIGVDSTLVSDADLALIGAQAEYETERELNTVFTPTTVIESYEGDGTNRVVLRRIPVLRVSAISIQGTTVTPAYTKLLQNSGVLWLTNNAEVTIFKYVTTTPYNNQVKYDYGFLDTTTTSTTLSVASTTGTSIVLSVASSSGFSTNSYAQIVGMDGNSEVFKVTATATGTITADALYFTHDTTSVITLLQVPPLALRYMFARCGLMAIARVVGTTYANVLSYTAGELSVTKGNPLESWKSSAEQFKNELDSIKKSFMPRPSIA